MPKRSLATTAAVLCGGALLLTGCGQAATSASTNAAAAPDVSASTCAAEDFRITMRAQQDPGSFLLELQNTSQQTCELGGWVHLTPDTSKGVPIDAPVEYLEVPSPAGGVQELEPGGTAYSGVRADYGETDIVAVGFTATPDNTNGKTIAEVQGAGEPYPRLPITHLRVGTLQPSPEGVLF